MATKLQKAIASVLASVTIFSLTIKDVQAGIGVSGEPQKVEQTIDATALKLQGLLTRDIQILQSLETKNQNVEKILTGISLVLGFNQEIHTQYNTLVDELGKAMDKNNKKDVDSILKKLGEASNIIETYSDNLEKFLNEAIKEVEASKPQDKEFEKIRVSMKGAVARLRASHFLNETAQQQFINRLLGWFFQLSAKTRNIGSYYDVDPDSNRQTS
jgi:hypothetical protein